MSFEVTSCAVLYFGPHRTIAGRMTGVVRVRIHENFMGTDTDYTLNLKVRADTGPKATADIKSALLAHAARQLNRIKARHAAMPKAANAGRSPIAAE
jgi:hypothetical protein